MFELRLLSPYTLYNCKITARWFMQIPERSTESRFPYFRLQMTLTTRSTKVDHYYLSNLTIQVNLAHLLVTVRQQEHMKQL
jgi:hypothetical protein